MLQVFFRHNIFLTLCESRPSPWRKTPPSCTKSTGTEIRRRVERRGSPSEQSPRTSRTCRETPAAATSRTLTATITTLKNCSQSNGKHLFSHRSIDGEGNDEDASEHVHDGDGEEEEVVGSVEVVTLLDDHAEGEVAEEADDDDDQVQDDVAPAATLRLIFNSINILT